MSKLHADYYADAMSQVTAPIEFNEEIAESTFRVRVRAPEIAAHVAAGQFVMMRIQGVDAPLIGRALAVYDVICDATGNPTHIDLVYLRKGAMTRVLAKSCIGAEISLWGPLGNGFRTSTCDRLIMAAGGIGQTPMLLLGRDALGKYRSSTATHSQPWAKSVELIYGARRKSLLAGVDDFRRAGFDVTLCTDDGSEGVKELVPHVLAERLRSLPTGESVRVVTCGPEIMMEKVAEVCLAAGVDCQVSMETPMACGIGICFSCVAKVRQDTPTGWDYKRTCVEGPIFDASMICW
jgi:dihydroorotate dehydrogenase electron transfer subunit